MQMHRLILVTILCIPTILFAQKNKPCLEAINKYCSGMTPTQYEICLDQNRPKLSGACIQQLDLKLAERKNDKTLAQKSIPKPVIAFIGQCHKGKVLCPDVVDLSGIKRKANTVPCPCSSDDCLSEGQEMCIDPKDEEKFAEDVKVSNGLISSRYNQCLLEKYEAKEDKSKCDSLHPFRYKGIVLPKTDEDCIRNFPIPDSVPPHERISYRMQVTQICSTEKHISPDHQKCILNEIPKGGYNQAIYNLSEASIKCDPVYKECKKAASTVRGSKKESDFLDQQCRINPALSAAEVECLGTHARKGKDFLEIHGPSKYLCLNKYQPCVERLKKNVKGQAKTTDLKVIATACQMDSDTHQDCVQKYLGSQYFSKKEPSHKEAQDVVKFCSIPNDFARECVKYNFDSGLTLSEAFFVCQYASESMRKCMSDFSLNKNEISGMKFPDKQLGLSFANEYCSYSEKKDQSCFLTSYKKLIGDNPHLEAVEKSRKQCHNFTRVCYNNYYNAFPGPLQAQLESQRYSIESICQERDQALQTCLFNKIFKRYDYDLSRNNLSKTMFGKTSYDISDYRKECLEKYTGFLIGEMPTIGTMKWECDDVDEAKIPPYHLGKYCDLGLYQAECEKKQMGTAWDIPHSALKTRCDSLPDIKERTPIEENLLRRCRIEKIIK